MKELLISQLVTVLVTMLNPEVLRKTLDSILDIVEEAVKESNTIVDDSIVLPLCQAVRTAFGVPDEDLEDKLNA